MWDINVCIEDEIEAAALRRLRMCESSIGTDSEGLAVLLTDFSVRIAPDCSVLGVA